MHIARQRLVPHELCMCFPIHSVSGTAIARFSPYEALKKTRNNFDSVLHFDLWGIHPQRKPLDRGAMRKALCWLS